jgi:RNA polymerase sigma-70 factor (ECF subfamily)
VLAAQIAESEIDLTTRARQGDREAFAGLVRSHYPGLVQVIYRLCGDASLAEDAAQETFLKAWQHLTSFKPGTSLRSWLYRIGINTALDALRRGRRAPLDLEAVRAADDAAGPEEALLQKERNQTVQAAILSLSEANRAILVLREYGGLSYAEIAETLDIPAGTVMSRLNYARNRLRELLEVEFGGQR